MSKQVREMNHAAPKTFHAWIVLDKKGREVARVHECSTNSMTYVDMWEQSIVYQGKAGGYGYDRFAAAIAGAELCGVRIFDHYGHDSDCYRMLARQPEVADLRDPIHVAWIDSLAKKGMYATNCAKDGCGVWTYKSVYYIHGLDRLLNFGYRVIMVL